MHPSIGRLPARVQQRDRRVGWLTGLVAAGLLSALAAVPPATVAAVTSYVPACSAVNIRASASTSASIKVRLGPTDSVTVVATVSGTSWAMACPTAKSGSGWYRISAVNGRSVSSLYGASYIYGATGVLNAAPRPAPTPAPTPSPTPAGSVITLGASTTFFGRGFGHGVGMSQYGARGRALTGQTAADILAHDYLGATIGSMAAGAQIRVLLLDNFAVTPVAPLVIFGRGGSWGLTGDPTTYPADARLRVFAPTAGPGAIWRMVVDDATGTVLADVPAPADLSVEPRGTATTLQLFSKPSGFDLYRGSLRVILATSTADVVNQLPLEDYLRGVVPAEMPSGWPVEARIAQTIAARSYAAYRLRPGTSTYDAYDDTRSQMYLGVRAENAASDAVVASTASQILLSGSSIANALFHSADGGATENNENVFVSASGARVAGPVPYLRGSADRDPTGPPTTPPPRMPPGRRPRTRWPRCRRSSGPMPGPASATSRRSTCTIVASRVAWSA